MAAIVIPQMIPAIIETTSAPTPTVNDTTRQLLPIPSTKNALKHLRFNSSQIRHDQPFGC
ncbi:MAG TPA: hypothetical protein VLF15_05020 [Pseudoxanthomonas sp.]|nr:hypothetical protein [Pseudoxanthomonas sp.]